ncbi:MAG TPA: DUF3344 domain-containing protein [Methanobacterium subterraneum]|uniref:DUF3344 domain-containing protein n=1 Tax=Methanobacterium subterraneum TaxID=59277 RepID=A0A7J4TIQ2_9EURY|nr:DUF3344 domain-containing protein [Methanobacterium subterraneum]
MKNKILFLSLALIFALIACGAVSADDYVGGQELSTDNGINGTVSGGVYVDAAPAPDWGNQTVTKTFTLPAGASENIVEARLYVSAYCGHMQNDNAFTITNKFDGNGDGIYETTWAETGHGSYNYMVNGGNDNSALGGGTNDPYLMINDHENRVTSDYLMWYNVTSLITGDTVNVNVDTTGSSDGRIKMITLIAAYNDGDDDQIMYWVNQGHDVCSYYTEYDGYVATGTTTFSTSDITGTVESANLTVDYLASTNGYYGFPTASNNFDASGGYPGTGQFTNQNMDNTPDVQGAYSGVVSWDVTDDVDNGEDVTLGYARCLTGTGTAAFYKVALAVLTVKMETESVAPPVAAFTSNVTSGTRPLAVQFTDQSTNNPTAWAWDFGDGSTSTLQNPTHTYTTAGTYTVTLNTSNDGGSDQEVKTDYITAHPNVDLITSGLVNTVPASAVFTEDYNNIRLTNVKNQGTDTATNIEVYLYASDVDNGNTPVATTTISSLAAGAQTTINLVDPTIRPTTANTVYGSSGLSYVTYTAVLDPNNKIFETNEANNIKNSASKPVLYNGYRGKGIYEYNGTDINTEYTYDLRGNIIYNTQPASAYKGVGWTTRTETWTGSDLPVPSTGTIEDVWLYLSYNWDYTDDGDPNWTISFNGNDITNSFVAWYTDQSNFGTYAYYQYGLMVFNVTSMFNRNGDNSLVMTPLSGNLNALYPSTLAVVYSDPNESRKQIFINEQCDELLLSEATYGTTLAQATTYAPFTGLIIDTINMSSATLHSFAGSGGPNEGNLLFNGNTVALAAWQGTSSTASALVADVTSFLTSTGNVAAIQGTSSGGMDTLQQFLVVEYADATPVAGFSGTPVTGDMPLTVQFTDESTGYVSSYAWDFDNDGNVDSTEKNPSWNYNTPGTYTVKLTVTNSGGSDEEVKTDYITVNGADLIVTGISPNVGTGAAFFANEPNVLSVTVKNNGTVTSEATTMDVDVGGVTYTVDVPALNAGASTTVTVTDTASHTGGSSVPVNANPNPSRNIPETNTSNNSFSTSIVVYNNGYKGKQYTDDDETNSLETQQVWEGHYDVIYSSGNTAYNGATWTEKTYSWTSSNLPIPAGATVVSARLYQSYTYNQMGVDPSWIMNFNGNIVSTAATYKDIKGFGSYNFPYGLYVYDVTSLFNTAGNTMTLTPEAGNNYGIYGAYLVVVYEDATTSQKKIYINDGFDMLCSRYTYSTNDAEATAYANYSGVSTTDLGNAKVIAILASADEANDSKFLFNGQEYTGFWSSWTGTSGPQIGFNTYDVTSHVVDGLNLAGMQSYDSTGPVDTNWGDNMYAMTAIFIAAYGPADLVVSDLELPENPIVGETYQITTTVTNNGETNAGPFTVKLMINGITISNQNIDSLASGTSTTLTWNWKPTTTGTHTIKAIADVYNTIPESYENNNQQTQTTTVTESTKPDLTITNIELPETPTVGETYQITTTVTNNGETNAGPFTVKLMINGITISNQNIDSLASGTSTTLTWNWKPTTTGTHTIKAIADVYNTIPESYENNNQQTQEKIIN